MRLCCINLAISYTSSGLESYFSYKVYLAVLWFELSLLHLSTGWVGGSSFWRCIYEAFLILCVLILFVELGGGDGEYCFLVGRFQYPLTILKVLAFFTLEREGGVISQGGGCHLWPDLRPIGIENAMQFC